MKTDTNKIIFNRDAIQGVSWIGYAEKIVYCTSDVDKNEA